LNGIKNKNDVCFAERGFDFAYVTRAFVDPNRMIKKDTRWNYGEERYQLFGAIDQQYSLLPIHCAVLPFELFQHERLINVRQIVMKTIRVSIDPDNPASLPEGRVDFNRLDATTECNIAEQQYSDETDAILDAAKFARRVRNRLVLSQAVFFSTN
jgi:uncharacterized DUF497 family protein